MSGFTSGKVSHDPLPWRDSTRYIDMRSSWKRDDDHVYAPRSQYDNHNPILVWLRAIWADPECGTHAEIIDYMLNDVRMVGSEFTPEHRNHAKRVLTKLANLERTNA